MATGQDTRFKPGQSGNPGGRPRDKVFMRELQQILAEGDGKKLERIVRKFLDLAEAGEDWAISLLWDRLEGKVPQVVKVTRDAREMSIDDILSELAEARAAAGIAGENSGEREPDAVH